MEVFKSKLKLLLKPPRYKFFNVGDKISNALVCRLRVERRYLHAHSFIIGRAKSPECWCQEPIESTQHYILHCWLFKVERVTLYNLVKLVLPIFENLPYCKQFDILMFGYKKDNPDFYFVNVKIQLALQKYVLQTKRFSLLPPPSPSNPHLSLPPAS